MKTRTCLVVGGTGGIGRYLVQAFAEEGYQVIFTYHKNCKEAELLENKYNIKGYCVDSSSDTSVREFRKLFNNDFNDLHALIYASGIFEDSLLEKMDLDSWNHVVSTNLTGAFLFAKYFIDLLRQSQSGRFVTIGSVMGESGIYGSCSYSTTKAGLIGLTKSIALENARYGVTANVVSFGYIDTGMTSMLTEKVLDSALKKIPMKRLGDPLDAAKVVVDTCSLHANYVSGQVIRCNGLLYV